jgi:hypothetical protein
MPSINPYVPTKTLDDRAREIKRARHDYNVELALQGALAFLVFFLLALAFYCWCWLPTVNGWN